MVLRWRAMYYTCTICSKHMGALLEDSSGSMGYPEFYLHVLTSQILLLHISLSQIGPTSSILSFKTTANGC